MRKNREEFAPFLIDPNSGEMLNEDEFEAYCRKVEKTTNWGGQPEVLKVLLSAHQGQSFLTL